MADAPSRGKQQTPVNGTRLLKPAEAATKLGVPETWVLSQARAGRLPSVKVGHYVRFDEEELEAWWKRRQRGPRSRAA